LKEDNNKVQAESVPGAVEMSAVSSVQENVTFEDAHAPMVDVIAPIADASYREDSDEMADLAGYLKRPVIIDTFTWSESDTFDLAPHVIQPWKLFFRNVYISRKLANYSRINCNLVLTFRFNASPFYYGLMRACYDPMTSGKFGPLSIMDQVPLSQLPGVYIQPQSESSVTLTLPFIWPMNWLDTTNTAEFEQMGRLYYILYSQLRSANGVAGGGITITTYAHAEDVVISGPTTKNILQSGSISGPSTAVASAASFFTNIPRIGPFARAIQVGATAVASVSKLFGYSNPPVLAPVHAVRNVAFHSLANVETSVATDVLALDPNNQVTIDNRVAGANGEDELAIPYLVQRESYIMEKMWTGARVAGDVLATVGVTPCCKLESPGNQQTFVYHTPASFVGRMFRFWHGTMVYKIKIVKSPFHRGRIMINWDPAGTCLPSGAETTVFTKIIDLSTENDEFEFEVPYKSNQPWLGTTTHGNNMITDGYVDYYGKDYNGTITISVLNVLTGPAADPEVDVLIFSYARPDMQFAAPRALPQNLSMNFVQSGVESGPISTGPVDGSSLSYAEHLPEITVGERVGSLRVLLHRSTHSITQPAGLCLTSGTVLPPGMYRTTNMFQRLPPQYGYGYDDAYMKALGLYAPAVTKKVNFCKVHPLNYVLHAFVGYRGSVVVDVNTSCAGGGPEGVTAQTIARIDHSPVIGAGNFVTNTAYWPTTASAGSAAISRLASVPGDTFPIVAAGTGALSLTNARTQAGLSAVIPQYNIARFYSVEPRDVLPGGAPFREDGVKMYDGFRIDTSFVKKDALSNDFPVLDIYWRAGVDFNPVFFTGVPRMYTYNLPAAVVS